MKNVLIIITSFGFGYALNTEPGKKLRNWAFNKVQNQIKGLVGKIDEVTESNSPSATPNTEEGK